MQATLRRSSTRSRPRIPQASSVLYKPVAGAISDRLANLTTETIQEISRPKDDYDLKEYFKLLQNCPIINAAYELKALRCAISLGKYTHPIKEAEKWVHSNIEQMEGKLEELVGHGSSAAYFGNFVAEIVLRNDAPGYRRQWRLQGFRPLDPRKITFCGSKYGITHVAVNTGGKKKYIPYSRVIHVVADHSSFGNPYGTGGLARRAMPWYKSKQLLMSEWVVAGLNQARGLLIGKADSNETVQILDSSGRPILRDGRPVVKSAVDNLLHQMMQLENSSLLATDLKNQIQWQPMPADANFFQLALQFVNRQLLLSQLLPSLTFEEGIGGLGNTGVATVQQGLLDTQIEFITDSLKDQLIEKVFRPLLGWNFDYTGRQGWGEFVVTPNRDPNVALSKASTIISAIVSQILPSADPAVINALRELLGLPQVEEPQMLEMLQKQIQQQAMQQQAMAPPAEAAPPEEQMPPQSGFAFYGA